MSNKRDSEGNTHSSYTPLQPEMVMKSVVNVLSYLVVANDGIELPPFLLQTYASFTSSWTYEWATVEEYVGRLLEWIVCGPECFIAALCMMKKLETAGAIPPITQRSVHRTYLTCLMLGVKYVEDETLCNADFAKVGCVATEELNKMERNACIGLSFGCAITPEDYEDMRADLMCLDSVLKRKSFKKSKTSEPVTLTSLCQSIDPSRRKSKMLKRNSTEEGSESKEKRTSLYRRSLNLMNRISGKYSSADASDLTKTPESPLEAPLVLNGEVGRPKSKKSLRFSLGKKETKDKENFVNNKTQAVAFFRQDSQR